MAGTKIKHEILTKQISESEEGYLLNDFEDAAVRFEKNSGEIKWYLKFKGSSEIEVQRSHRLVTDAILDSVMITETEYNSF